MALRQAFSSDYVVGDNAREYLPWMYQFSNPDLFPNDLIANYFKSVTPPGYNALYRLIAGLGIDIILASKLLSIVLALLTTSYGFAVCLQILPVPIAGFISTLLLSQSLAMHDDFVSACPRDFIYPLFLAFLYYLLRGLILPTLVAIALQGLFYPPLVFILSGILLLRLWSWQSGQLHLSKKRRDYTFCILGLGTALLAIVPYAIQSSEFGPTITASVAKTIPEYLDGGRVRYFHLSPLNFWLDGRESGVLAAMNLPQIFIGLVLPILLLYPSRFPLTQQMNGKVKILSQIVLASLGMFFVAHTLAFQLHWPSRYTHHTFKMVLALASGIALTLMLDAAFHWSEQLNNSHQKQRQILVLSIATLVGAGLILYPSFLKVFPSTPYVVGREPALYKFLQQQPKDSLIASLAGEADNLPAFAQRSILVGREYALPFHTRYYKQFRQRVIDLIDAQYSLDINQAKSFIHKYGVSFWLLERTAFQPEYITKNSWIKQYQPAADEALAKLKQRAIPTLLKLMKPCAVFETQNLVVLKATCLENSQQK